MSISYLTSGALANSLSFTEFQARFDGRSPRPHTVQDTGSRGLPACLFPSSVPRTEQVTNLQCLPLPFFRRDVKTETQRRETVESCPGVTFVPGFGEFLGTPENVVCPTGW